MANITIIAQDTPVTVKTNVSVVSTSNESLYAFINVNDAYTVQAYHTNNPSGAYINESINFKTLPIAYTIAVLFTIDRLLIYSFGLFIILAIINNINAITAITIADITAAFKKPVNNSASFIASHLNLLSSDEL